MAEADPAFFRYNYIKGLELHCLLASVNPVPVFYTNPVELHLCAISFRHSTNYWTVRAIISIAGFCEVRKFIMERAKFNSFSSISAIDFWHPEGADSSLQNRSQL